MAKKKEEKKNLYHYTNIAGLKGILSSGKLLPSLRANYPRRGRGDDARYGDGQYVTDIVPSNQSPEKLSRIFTRSPKHSSKYTHYIEIDVSDLNVKEGREHVYLIPNDKPLDLKDRLISWGVMEQAAENEFKAKELGNLNNEHSRDTYIQLVEKYEPILQNQPEKVEDFLKELHEQLAQTKETKGNLVPLDQLGSKEDLVVYKLKDMNINLLNGLTCKHALLQSKDETVLFIHKNDWDNPSLKQLLEEMDKENSRDTKLMNRDDGYER